MECFSPQIFSLKCFCSTVLEGFSDIPVKKFSKNQGLRNTNFILENRIKNYNFCGIFLRKIVLIFSRNK